MYNKISNYSTNSICNNIVYICGFKGNKVQFTRDYTG